MEKLRTLKIPNHKKILARVAFSKPKSGVIPLRKASARFPSLPSESSPRSSQSGLQRPPTPAWAPPQHIWAPAALKSPLFLKASVSLSGAFAHAAVSCTLVSPHPFTWPNAPPPSGGLSWAVLAAPPLGASQPSCYPHPVTAAWSDPVLPTPHHP